MDSAVWRTFCDRIAALGDRVLADATDERSAAEGIHHLANQVACWLTYALGQRDPAHPAFFRSSDPVYQWGGPNADQVARRAAIEGTGTYRISGRMGSCEEFVLQVKQGGAQSGGAGVATEVTASALGIGPGDDIEIHLAPTEQPGTWIRLEPDAAFVHVRDYYFDWRPSEPATFVIERLDRVGEPRPARTADSVAAVLEYAYREVEHSIGFWSGYQTRMLAGQAPNRFGPPAGAGVQDIVYSHASVVLAPDEALVVDVDPADAPMWDVQLYNRPWYEGLDVAGRVTSLNHRLASTDEEGRVRIIVAHEDPGVANWLDTEGRPDALATFRWWRPSSPPTVDSRVTTAVDVATTAVGPDARRQQLARRAAHLAWRYRT